MTPEQAAKIAKSLTYSGPLPSDLWELLNLMWQRGGLSVQSDWARAYAIPLGLAASMGWITTLDPSGQHYGNRWRLSAEGVTALQHKEYLA